ncbi:homeobox protein ATH1 [Brachypodium distachyon]|uniref:Homeobox domain-containing protein n=1 Tax=Brachypodium distachyon TaxID=15368 RepID=A0A0Q3F7D7_BRADI|nr:homeobox protein ATH1 [Brachypodium distachyon]XP_024316333.1 homeobox protein ATH1 [Brachypodium distachyon]XP_024316334.1 homeobox protein ATH1 [Brachypodium distachyon]XP_024316335.1 homeobox protein ATH1 [Brachypodium distachyon]KQJ94108.1 hypothetical protein BRADI_3g08570v3 [Brachypodium distachyon]PNT66208.1 hypothetical protein BRADI_3g08570v3 [Brachypodium distachyon]PNT66209.1 hypothetical protein BRADI_3g08570v3 [Brachypodium distachyon]PNT66210.1 hypothetical protein BRADI_3g0|eukprot:XP_010236337.2 homeobox protein ATH1 [Brachypodium distachyon]
MGSTSNPSFSPFGAEAMNGYFMASTGAQGMPLPPPDHGGYGGGGLCFGDAADIGAQFSANNMLFASLASQLFAPPQPHGGGHGHVGARTPPPEVEEMDGEFEASGGDYCHLDAQAMAICSSSSSKKPRCDDWSSAEGSRAVSVYGPPPQTAGFYYYPPATPRELSLSLRSVSSSDSMSMASGGDQFSSGSGLTHTRSHSQQGQAARFRPVHFAVVVARSPYAPVAQQLLNDAVGRLLHGVAAASSCSASSSVVSSNNNHHGARWGHGAHGVRGELLRMLQLMDEKYNQCLDEIQATTAKFNSLAQPGIGIGIGGICAPFAHRAVSATYRALRRRITGEIMAAAAGGSRPRSQRAESSGSWESAFIQKHLAAQQARRREQHSWRPQRGLPEKSVAVLKSWLFENFIRPYPQDSEKDMLAERSGLTRTQVANWFINARVRLWRPLIEELHEELRRSSAAAPAMPMEHAVSQYVLG